MCEQVSYFGESGDIPQLDSTPLQDLSIHQQQESHLQDTQLDGGGEQPM